MWKKGEIQMQKTIIYKWSSIYKILKLEQDTETLTKFLALLKRKKHVDDHLLFFLNHLFNEKNYIKKFYTGKIF